MKTDAEQPAQQPVLAARWPGYAIEGGRLYQTSGRLLLMADEEGRVTQVQCWEEIEKLHRGDLLALLQQPQRLAFTSMPSDGWIL